MSETGWKPIPLPLKILFVVLILWAIGAVMNLPNLLEKNGLPLFGNFVYGVSAALVVLLLDIVGPAIFLFAVWSRKSWAANWAYAYMGLFVLNSTVAFFTVRDELGLPQILIPTIAVLIFLSVIFWKRDYFERT
jgi:hypothetical protein